eukprot:Polyplicarium_translucidae@DN2626_c0_g1_i2.p1
MSSKKVARSRLAEQCVFVFGESLGRTGWRFCGRPVWHVQTILLMNDPEADAAQFHGRCSDSSSSDAVRTSSADRRTAGAVAGDVEGPGLFRREWHVPRRQRPANPDGRSYSSNPRSRGKITFADSWKRSGSVDGIALPEDLASSSAAGGGSPDCGSGAEFCRTEGSAKTLAIVQSIFLGGLLLSFSLGSCLHSVKLRSLRFVSNSPVELQARASPYSFLQTDPFPFPFEDGERCAEQHQHDAFPGSPHIAFRHEFMRNSFLLFNEIGPFDRLYLIAKEPSHYNLTDALPSDPFPIVACNYPHWRDIRSPMRASAVQAWLPSLTGCCGFEKNSIMIQNAGHSAFASRIPTPMFASTASTSREINRLQRLFRASKGYVTPCYCFARQFSRYVSGTAGYIPFVLLWMHSVLSPQPLTLVHVPRLWLYAAFAAYRYVFLYLGVNFVERRVSAYDMSDHAVLYIASTMYLSIEYVAIARSHPRPLEAPEEFDAVPVEDDTVHSGAAQLHSAVQRSMLWVASIARSPKQVLLYVGFRGFCLLYLLAVWYSAFYTAVFFHHRREVFTGVIVGVAGSYGVFWLVVGWLGVVSLERIGLISRCFRIRKTRRRGY